MASIIRRIFGTTDDVVPGGSTYDSMVNNTPAYTPPDATSFWPVTGGNLDRGLERITRETEVRSRRPVNPPITFRSTPMLTFPGPAYPSLLKKLIRRLFGGTDVVSGAGPYVHTITPLPFGATQLPAGYYQMIRDDLNQKMSGGAVNRLAVTMPLDGEAAFDTDIFVLYYMNSAQTAPTPSFSDVNDVLMLRDVTAYIDGSGNPLATPTAPTLTGAITGGTLTAGTYQYRITATNATGETLAGPEAVVAGTVASGTTGSVVITWSAVTSATGYNVYGRTAGGELKLVVLGNVLTYTDTGALTPAGALPAANSTGGTIIPDLITFDFSFTNGLLRKWYAGRNIVTRTIGTVGIGYGALQRKLWFPTEHKLGAAQDVTYAFVFGNTSTAQDLALDFGQIQRFIVNAVGGIAPSTAYNEALGITLYAAEHSGAAGPDALAARGDITYRVEGGAFYSDVDAADIQVQITDGVSTPTT